MKEEIKRLKHQKKSEDLDRRNQIERVKQAKNQNHTYRQNERAGEILKQNQHLVEKLYDIQNPKVRSAIAK